MPYGPVFGVPGYRTEIPAAFRNVRKSSQGTRYLPGGIIINGALSRDPANTSYVNVLRAGLLMGKITATGLWAPSVIGLNTVLHDTSVVTTTMTLPASVVTEIQRRIGASGTFKITGPPTAAGTVATETVTFSAIASATTLTITATAADFAAGSLIRPTDGSETALGLIDNGPGVQVTDPDGNNLSVDYPTLLIGGILDSSQIINWSSDASVVAFLKGLLNNASNDSFTFDDAFGS